MPAHGPHVILPIWQQITSKDYETHEIKALLALVHENDTVLELGAGMGVVSGIAAKQFPSIRVVSFEANPYMIGPIRELHKINSIQNATVHNELLTHGEGGRARDFHIAWSFAESSVIAEGARKDSVVKVTERNVQATLNDLKPDLIVCDIEGGETEIFEKIDLAGVRAIILELHPKVIGRSAEARIYDSIIGNGFYPVIDLCGGTVVAFERVEKRSNQSSL